MEQLWNQYKPSHYEPISIVLDLHNNPNSDIQSWVLSNRDTVKQLFGNTQNLSEKIILIDRNRLRAGSSEARYHSDPGFYFQSVTGCGSTSFRFICNEYEIYLDFKRNDEFETVCFFGPKGFPFPNVSPDIFQHIKVIITPKGEIYYTEEKILEIITKLNGEAWIFQHAAQPDENYYGYSIAYLLY